MPGWLVASDGTLTVALDIELTDALKEEGVAREIINRIQNLRKTSGLEITDRIVLHIERNDNINSAVEHFREYISGQVLATEVRLTDMLTDATHIEDMNINVKIEKAL